MKRRAMTYVELIIYVALAATLALLSGSLFLLSRRNAENTNANYFLTADTESAAAWLRRDLQQCALATIQVYPAGQAGQPPGASWCSALNPEDVKQIDANETGNPNWRNHVYYTLQPLKDNVGKLVRWSSPTAADALTTPTLAPLLPSAIVASRSRSVHTRVLLPNQTTFGVGSDAQTDEHGGFRIRFVRRQGEDGEESLSDQNPATASLDASGNQFASNTRLVEVELKFFTSTSTGKPSFYSLRFRVCPRY